MAIVNKNSTIKASAQPNGSFTQNPKYTSILDLSSQQKAAAILLNIGQNRAAEILNFLTPQDLIALSNAAKALPNIAQSDLDLLVQEFEQNFAINSEKKTDKKFNKALQNSLNTQIASEIFELNNTNKIKKDDPFEQLANLSPQKIYYYLYDEHPQFFAYIFSKLPSDIASKIVLLMPAKQRSDVIKRVLNLGDISTESKLIAKEALAQKLTEKIDQENNNNYKQIANIFNNMEKAQIDNILNNLEGFAISDIENIKARLFTFEDIPKLTLETRMLIFDGIDPAIIIASLKGTSQLIRDKILSALSQRMRRLIVDDIQQNPKAYSLEEITKARRYIAKRAIELSDNGAITLFNEQHSTN